MARVRLCMRLLVVAGLLVLHGCTLLPQGRDTPAPVESREGRPVAAEVETAPVPAPPAKSPPLPAAESRAESAYAPLLARADSATRAGDYDQAISLLERAQRIDPDNARIYLELARTYAARGYHDRAQVMAERGLLYCRSERECEDLRAYLPRR